MPPRLGINPADVDDFFAQFTVKLVKKKQDLALSFPDWLRETTPKFEWGWRHLRYVQEHLERVTSGELKRLMIFMPPRHGKSEMVTIRYPVYRMEQEPSTKVVVAAYNKDLATNFSRAARRIALGRLDFSKTKAAVDEWETAQGGGLKAAGVGSGVTGRGAKLLIIDDPVKSRAEAESASYQKAVWDWYNNDLYTRLEPGGALILIMTRWNLLDLAGRILDSDNASNWTVISLPAIAMPNDPLGRQVGEALCPDRYDIEALSDIRTTLGPRDFGALYQQTPTLREGNLFKAQWFEGRLVEDSPVEAQRVRFWDKASLEGEGDFTVGLLMAKDKQERYYVEDIIRGQWGPDQRDAIIQRVSRLDHKRFEDGMGVTQWVEQDAGSGGKDASVFTARLLAGTSFGFVRPANNKPVRADPFASACGAGNVFILDRPWTEAFISELLSFPSGIYDDQVDAGSGAFAKLAIPDIAEMDEELAELLENYRGL